LRRVNEELPSILLGVVVIILTLTGCLNLKIPNKIIRTSNDIVIRKANTLFPIESFVMVNQRFMISQRTCIEEECQDVVVGTHAGSGSGFIVRSDDEVSYVMTAGHVCTPPPPNFAIDPTTISVSYDIRLKTGFGRESTSEIIAIDSANDLCLLRTPTRLGPSLEISDDELMLHERVYNMASPAGLASSLAVPVFDGYYTGNVANLSIFSIPAVPGSSGSPIMTEDNRVVSLVSAAAIKFDEYAIGPQTRAIREFLLANLPD
jgi:S1-C subfamily serine protease